VSYQQDGNDRGDLVWLIDFANPENNEFVVANQFTVIENHQNKRPDIILFINGLPLVVIEIKNPADENATVKTAYQQLDTYKYTIPGLFTYNALLVISDGLEAKAGSLSAGLSRFMAWKSVGAGLVPAQLGQPQGLPLRITELETLINGMLNKATLLDLIRHFIVFEKSKKYAHTVYRQADERPQPDASDCTGQPCLFRQTRRFGGGLSGYCVRS
jgi:type I restriction enzyme R subunit